MTREEVVAGLRAGRVLVVDRRDSPVLPIALALVDEGVAEAELVVHDEQSSAFLFWARGGVG